MNTNFNDFWKKLYAKLYERNFNYRKESGT